MGAVVVARGEVPARPLPQAPEADVLDLPVSTASVPQATLAEALSLTDTDAFLVLHDGALACEYYRTPEIASTPHPLLSVTKSVVGCLAGVLIDDGRLDPDAPASGYVPELAEGGYAAATVRDLLDMRTGGDYLEAYDDPGSELAQLGQICGWWPRTDPTLPGSVRAWLVTLARPAACGGPFTYRSADTEVLGWVVETVAGAPLATLIGEAILAPIGAEADGRLEVDPAGHALASGGLALVPRDLARFGQMLLDGGSVGHAQVVPTRFVKDTYTGQDDSVAAFHARIGATLGPDAPFPPKGLYRNQFWVLEQGSRRLLCLGAHGQMVLVDGDNRVVAVKVSSWAQPQDPARFEAGLACLVAAAEALGGHHDDSLSLHR